MCFESVLKTVFCMTLACIFSDTESCPIHFKGYEYLMYEDIFAEVHDLLMYDTVLVCLTKAKQLVQRGVSSFLCIIFSLLPLF